MKPFYQLAFFVLVLWNENLPTVHRVADSKPKQVARTFKTFGLCHFPDLFGVVPAGREFLEGPAHNFGLGFIEGDIFAPVRVCAIDITDRRMAHKTAFFSRPAHSIKDIQCPAVVLHFRRSEVEGQHHLVFRDREV
ncbi:MAG TPA: hypothetical protein VGS79_25130 [Puia sp.]|nr:hypothetical protein [Puia sp.]